MMNSSKREKGWLNLVKHIHELVKGKKVLFVCMGNELMGDDGVGVYIAKKLREKGLKDKVLNVGIYLENHLGKICMAKPDIVIFIDAIDAKRRPGDIILGRLPDIEKEITLISTHGMPLSMALKILYNTIGSIEAYIIGVQIERARVGEKMSKNIMDAGNLVAEAIYRAMASL
ncbi:MAG TPA: hydrogenase maturation protease [Thermoprotei archaeon]|nr:hydrogenase maturation protease [Thermoprotei archaeon]